MSVRYHGNWCGPGWSAGQWKNAADLTTEDFQVEAIDELDQACKNHDVGLRFAKNERDVRAANRRFYREAAACGFQGTLAALLVGAFGPSEPGMSFYNLPWLAYVKT